MKKNWKPFLKKNDLQIKSKKLLLSSYLKLFNYNIKIKSFKDKNVKIITRDLIAAKNSVSILLFDPLKNLIMLVEQFRIGDYKRNPWTLEVISGTVNPCSKNVINFIIKETKEESNIRCLDIIYLLSYLNSPGISNEITYLYLGIFNSKRDENILGLSGESEELKTHLFDLDVALSLIGKGIINHPSSIISILWLKNKYYDILK